VKPKPEAKTVAKPTPKATYVQGDKSLVTKGEFTKVGDTEKISDDDTSEEERVPYQLIVKFSYSAKEIAQMFKIIPSMIKS
jgi:hypothetical protein